MEPEIEISGEDLTILFLSLKAARSVRFAIDGGGLKISLDRGTWSPPIGQELS